MDSEGKITVEVDLKVVWNYIKLLQGKDPRLRFLGYHFVSGNFLEVSECLGENTGQKRPIKIQPEELENNPWWQLQREVARYNNLLAETICRWWYKTVLREQDRDQERYHKGTPLMNIANYNLARGKVRSGRRYASLAMIEDALTEPGRYKSFSAWSFLSHSLRISERELSDLATFAQKACKERKNTIECRCPEKLLADFLSDPKCFKVRDTERDLFDINLGLAEELLKRVRSVTDPNEKGRTLENLAEYLFFSVEGFEVYGKNVGTQDYEMDLVIRNSIDTDVIFEEFGRYLLVECKNWDKPVGVREINHFLAKIRFHDCKTGVLLSKSGISGERSDDELRHGKLTILKAFYNDKIIIIVLDEGELESIVKGDDNLLSVLLKNYEKVKFGQF